MISGINHITFAVKNLNVSLQFYQDILGCQCVTVWKTGAYLQAGDLWLCLSLDQKAQQKIPAHYSHIAFNILPKDFDTLKQRFIKNRIKCWKENKSEGESLYFLDPDFHKLEIHYSTLQNRLKVMKKTDPT